MDSFTSTSPAPSAIADLFLPGFGLITQVLSSVLHVDVSKSVPFLFLFAITAAASFYSAGEISRFFRTYFLSTAEIHIEDEVYDYVMYWLTKQQFIASARNFAVTSNAGHESSRWSYTDDGDENKEHDDDDSDVGSESEMTINGVKLKRMSYIPSVGTHFFWYRRRLLIVRREQVKSHMWTERLFLSTLTRRPTFLKELLQEAQMLHGMKDANKTIIYRGTKSKEDPACWTRCMARHSRPMSTVMLDAKMKEEFLEDVKEYLQPSTKRWYSNRGIPYRRGYLLYGPPGCGKTSLCFAAAGDLNLKIYVVSLNSRILTEEALTELFSGLPKRCIVLLEDIDTSGITQKRQGLPSSSNPEPEEPDTKDAPKDDDTAPKPSPEGEVIIPVMPSRISLSALLNTIDGIASSEGRILVMTTNHIENLDPALLRPGRVDMTIEFSHAKRQTCIDLFRAIYTDIEGDIVLPTESKETISSLENGTGENNVHVYHHPQHSQEEISKLAVEFGSKIPEGEFTPAELQGYLLKYKKSPRLAVEQVEEWVASKGTG